MEAGFVAARAVVVAVVLVAAASALPHPQAPAALGASGEFPAPLYFEQDQDHFDGTNTNRWQQAFYVNDTFWASGSSAPVFLCVGGEGPPLDGSAVVSSVHCNVAVEWLAETGALMFALEHRYYGCHNRSACPVTDLSAKNALHFLSSRQALADIAAFHAFATKAYHLTSANQWVTWGGSYPGMLAGWARLKFPHLFAVSVASSAPVRAQLDMVGYMDVVAEAFNSTTAGGSPACMQAIADGHVTIGKMLNGTDDDRKQLAQLFSISDPESLKNLDTQRAFAGYGVAEFDAQSNDPACTTPACNIQRICAIMTDASAGSNVERLAKVRAAQEGEAARRVGANERFWNAMRASPRQRLQHKLTQRGVQRVRDSEPDYWGWQTCTEFGFYQTCEKGSKCMFTQGLATLDYLMGFCESEFGIAVDTVQHNIDFTNVYYGADKPAGSRVLWPNGEIDPWHALSVLSAPSAEQATLWVLGASHHYWTHPSLPSDSDAILTARHDIREQVTLWL